MAVVVPGEKDAEQPVGGAAAKTSYTRQTVFSTITQAAIYASGILLTPLLFKTSGPAIYGEYTLLLSLAGFLFGTATMGVGFYARRYLPSATTNAERIDLFYPQFWGNLVIVALVCVVIVAAGGVLTLAGITETHQYLFLSSFLLAQAFYSQGADYLRSTHRTLAFSIMVVTQPYLYIGSVLCQFAILGRIDLNMLLWTQVGSMLLVGLYGLAHVVIEMRIRFVLPTLDQVKRDLMLGGPLVLSYIMDVLLAFSDRYVIGLLIGFEGVGFYAVAYTLGSVPLFMAKALTVALPVRLARLIDDGQQAAAEKVVSETIRLYMFIAIPYAIGTIVLGPRVVALYASDAAAAAAGVTLPVIALATVLYGIFLVFTTVCTVELRSAEIFKANAMAAVLNLGLNLLMMYFVRDIAIAAFTTLAAYGLIVQRMIARTERGWQVALSVNVILPIVGSAIIMGLVVWLALNEIAPFEAGIFSTVALIGLGGVSYLAASLATGAITRRDLSRAFAVIAPTSR